jgi:hypothetical protein
MTREPLERLLHNVTDEELESLRDAILREEGRRRSQFELAVEAPYPPLVRDEQSGESTVMRWAKLLTWLAKDMDFSPAAAKRGVSIRMTFASEKPDPQAAAILLQEALVEAGLLVGRTPEWMDATTTQVEPGDIDAVYIQMWDKPAPAPPWS